MYFIFSHFTSSHSTVVKEEAAVNVKLLIIQQMGWEECRIDMIHSTAADLFHSSALVNEHLLPAEQLSSRMLTAFGWPMKSVPLMATENDFRAETAV